MLLINLKTKKLDLGEQCCMPNIKSAIKRMRSNETKRQRNLDLRSEVKTAIKKVRTAVEKNELETAKLLLQDAYASLDKAAKKNVIHANNASRRKARIAQQLQKALSKA